MPEIKKLIARKAARSAVKHTARGTASKVKRSPFRAMTLLGLGGAVGAFAGWMIGRSATGAGPVGTGA
jgi:hypothetical protein